MRISEEDEAFLRKWFEGIAGKNGFEKSYKDFMGDDPSDESRPGSNRRILNDFIDAKKHQPLAAYALSVYGHTVAGQRVKYSFSFSAYAVGLSLIVAGVTTLTTHNPELVGVALMAYGVLVIAYLKVTWWRKEKNALKTH
jgi:hypothetical protein